MSGNALETAGAVSSGGTITLAASFAWLEVNSSAISIIVMVITMIMMGMFYAASIYLRRQEVRIKEDKVKKDVVEEFYFRINEIDAKSSERGAAKEMLKEIMNRRC